MNIFGFDTEKSWDYENGFYLTSSSKRLAKAMAQYELYKSILGLPGDVVECGVFKGASLIRWATFREALESQNSRMIVGFDAFGKFPASGDARDRKFAVAWEEAAGTGISMDELTTVMNQKGFQNYVLDMGDICETVPQYVHDHPQMKIALLHVDVDVYRPTKTVLDHLYDKVVRGGLIVFDDYGTLPGETQAVDEFFAGKDVLIEKLGIGHIPSFVRKQ